MMNRREFVSLAGAYALAGLAPAATFAQGKKLRIAFANYNDEASFGTLVLRGVQEAAKKHPDIEVIYFDNRQDPARTVENARTVATMKPDAFIEYNSVVPEANPQVGRLMKQAGVPVLSVQVPVPDSPLYAVDNRLAGLESGKAIANAAQARFADSNRVFLILGQPEGGALFRERSAGAIAGIQSVYSGAKYEEQSTKNDPSVARQVTTDFLTKNPGRKIGIWAHVDGMAIAALTAARAAGRERDVVISATGGESVTFPEIRNPESAFVGTFSFFPEKWGEDLLPLARKLALGQTLPAISHPTQQLFLSASNLNQFYPKS